MDAERAEERDGSEVSGLFRVFCGLIFAELFKTGRLPETGLI